MICKNEMCETVLTGNQQRFCCNECGVSHRRKTRSFKSELGNECRYCKDSNHTKFYCQNHEQEYETFRKRVDNELLKAKPKPTEAQLKAFQGIENLLNRPL